MSDSLPDDDERDRRAAAAIKRAFDLEAAKSRQPTSQPQTAATTGSSQKNGRLRQEDAAKVIQDLFRSSRKSGRLAEPEGKSSKSNGTPLDKWQQGASLAGRLSGDAGSRAPNAAREKKEDKRNAEQTETVPNTLANVLKDAKGATAKDKIKIAKAYAYNRDASGHRKPFGRKEGQKAVKVKKKLEEQHWLEMLDEKHRYGSNMKYYFEEWQSRKDTQGSFFDWLDHGEGASLSLKECPREKLEKECIIYLTAEQRKHYLVAVDSSDGKFRWASPTRQAVEYTGDAHPPVDTTARNWTDLGQGQGMAPSDAVHAAGDARTPSSTGSESDTGDDSSETSSNSADFDDSSSSHSSVDFTRPTALRRTSSDTFKPLRSDPDSGKISKNGQMSKHEAKKEKGDVWIYVSDENYRLYVGIKQKGTFQHSSFLAGGPITSAGTMIVRDGVLLKCNPMSGHYRTKANYFRHFIDELESQGADLSQVKVGTTELKLWFVERANTLHAAQGKMRRLKKQVAKKLNVS